MKFWTESGSVYEIKEFKIRRINDHYQKRADNEWVELLNEPQVELGHRVVLVTESLSRYGSDDYGHDEGGVTWRTTTPVTRVER